MMTSAGLEAEREAAMKQAASASRAAETLMDSGADGKGDSAAVKDLEKKLKEAKDGVCHSNVLLNIVQQLNLSF